MAFDPVFASAYIDAGHIHRVLGKRLRPFCLWHLYLLQVADSPFLQAGTVNLYHLRRAVGICRLRYQESKTKLPIFPIILTPPYFKREVQKFLDYVGDYLHRPEYTIMPLTEFNRQKSVTRGPSPAPDAVQVAFDAASGANVPIREAWEMPIGQAYIAQAMFLKRQGMLVDFMNESEREFQKAMKARNGAK